ncbi:hypothetical protein [Luteolibacter sp. AS25]|uniref:hypothetical protein n=1 Tax=Luteolibacter sp. AS25 TaxID=3135776 RepID=UPI00398ADB0F
MKFLFLCFALTSAVWGQDALVDKPGPDVAPSAVKAVADLGKQVVMGKYLAAVDKMYPQWKERTAARMGGMAKLEAQLQGVAKQMLQQGISIIEFTPVGQPTVHEVGMGKTVVQENGQQVEKMRYTKWLVLVPTSTKFRAMVDGKPEPILIESTGFQVAIADKNKLDWTFIDGASVTVHDLRSLFVNLPVDLALPPLEKRQIK